MLWWKRGEEHAEGFAGQPRAIGACICFPDPKHFSSLSGVERYEYAFLSSPHPSPTSSRAQLYDLPALRMSSNAARAHPDTHSLSYIARSGLAGGVAGCVVRPYHSPYTCSSSDMLHRQKQSLRRLTESRSYSRLPIQTIRNMQVRLLCILLISVYPSLLLRRNMDWCFPCSQ